MVKLSLKPGDGVIYQGCGEDWREPYEGDYHMQTYIMLTPMENTQPRRCYK